MGKRRSEKVDSSSKRAKMQDANNKYWSLDDVTSWLKENDFEELCSAFQAHEIDGRKLLEINPFDDLETIIGSDCFEKMQNQRIVKLLGLLTELQSKADACKIPDPSDMKIINDSIHGHMEIHPLAMAIVDTPQFQRLRRLKQLGGCYFVFPGASHNRFEHSLGVYHLATQYASELRKRQPEMKITDKDVLCVGIAGLCHDLGHGPFSHLFDGQFIPRARPDSKWKHEDASVAMFDYLIQANGLEELFAMYNISDDDVTFIKEAIVGPSNQASNGKWPYKGRPAEKAFLYQIVANKQNGMDVDKWDYFARDCHHLGIRNNFDHQRIMKFARIVYNEKANDYGGKTQIALRDKEVAHVYAMYHTRDMLHRQAYQHKTSNIIETMITEALLRADEFITFKGDDGKRYRISECIDNMSAYCRLTDDVYGKILDSESDELAPAREILERIERRQLYKLVAHSKIDDADCAERFKKGESVELREKIARCKSEAMKEEDYKSIHAQLPLVTKDTTVVHLVNLNYGFQDKNPVDNVRFYKKESPKITFAMKKKQISNMLPENFWEQQIRVYTTNENLVTATRACFKLWVDKETRVSKMVGYSTTEDLLTPSKPPLRSTKSMQPGTVRRQLNTQLNDVDDDAELYLGSQEDPLPYMSAMEPQVG